MTLTLNARLAQQLLNLLSELPRDRSGKVNESAVKAIFVKNKLKNCLTDKLKDYTSDSSKVLELLNANRNATQEFVKEIECKFTDKEGVTILTNEDGSQADKEKVESVREFLNNNNEKFNVDSKELCTGSYTINVKGQSVLWIKTDKTVSCELNDAESSWLKERFEENATGSYFHTEDDIIEISKVLGVEGV